MAQLAFSQRLHAAYTHTSAGRVHLSREPWDGAAGIQIAGALGGSLWQCQATVLWDPDDVPGDVRCDVRHCGTPQVLPGGTIFGRLMAFSISHSRPVRGLPLLFLWASEGNVPGDVRHFGRPRLAP